MSGEDIRLKSDLRGRSGDFQGSNVSVDKAVDNRERGGILAYPFGAVVQLGERLTGSQEVRGSTPLGSIFLMV